MQHMTGLILLAALCHCQPSAANQRMERRTSVRAALANKLDPNFWPSRGRRDGSSTYKHLSNLHIHPHLDNIQSRQTSDEDGPFWANRGRSLTEIDQYLTAVANDRDNGASSSKLRSIELDGPFWANRGRALGDDGPFWANRGRATEDDGPFWTNKGRSTKESGPFWIKQGRALDSISSNEDGPFWANRGRREEGEDEGTSFRRDTLYVEEPGYKYVDPERKNRSADLRRTLGSDGDTFWVARGKKAFKLRIGVFHPKWYSQSSLTRKTRK